MRLLSPAFILSFRFLFLAIPAQAQAVYNTGIERDMQSDGYLRLHYQNDFFTATDYYFTQGVLLEFAHPGFRRFFLNKAMIRPCGWSTVQGIGAEQNGYTPTDYVPAQIQYGDRPFAGTLSLKYFLLAKDTLKRQRVSSALNLGVIGPLAGAGDIQTYIHERTPNAIPHGWHNQVANDIVLQYHAGYERQLLRVQDYFIMAAVGTINAGTISNKAALGLTFMAGWLDTPFSNRRSRKFRLYLYDHPGLSLVGHDATLQGSLFHNNSPYVLPGNQVSRVVFRNNWGIIARLGKVYLEYYQSFITKEFNTGLEMRNGGFQVGCSF
jgi:lipid A 3-O-deacylase